VKRESMIKISPKEISTKQKEKLTRKKTHQQQQNLIFNVFFLVF